MSLKQEDDAAEAEDPIVVAKIGESEIAHETDNPRIGEAPDPHGENVEDAATLPKHCQNFPDAAASELLPATLQARFLRVKKMVAEAIASHRTFMICGKSRVIRDSLLSRGWCEKLYSRGSNGECVAPRSTSRSRGRSDELGVGEPSIRSLDASPVTLLAGIGDLKDERGERLLVSRMLADTSVDFLWNSGSEWAGWPSRDNSATLFNRYCRAGFTSKLGLCSSLRQMYWYYEAGVANTLFPRCYNISQSDQMHAFVEDFRFTACLSLLKWLAERMSEADGESSARSPTGTIPLKALDFAIGRCVDYMAARSHEDIDREADRIWSHQWDQFICWYYKIVHGEALFVGNGLSLEKYYLASRHILKKIKKYWHQLEMDGTMNIWILKPGNKSRGRGIVLVNKLEDVVARVNPAANKTDTRYVVQKYIERPMLIHGAKFDIRQWFIVTCAQPLTLWMYKESYLRFCSKNYQLTDFHESIHLCNNAVQCKYENSPERHPALPADNMWDATTFKQFLKERGDEDVWDRLIYPGMRQSLVGSLLASQEAMDRRKNSFELYGADFMLMDDYSVWLIEINSHPDMSYSSSVTTRLCKKVMEDTIKVVIDLREDKNADTGLFELAYRQRAPSRRPYPGGAALSLRGSRISGRERKPEVASAVESITSLLGQERSKEAPATRLGPAVVDLIEELELRLDREFVELRRRDLDSSATPEASRDSPALAISVAATEIANRKSSKKSSTTESRKTSRGPRDKGATRSERRSTASTTTTTLKKTTTRPSLVSRIVQLGRETARTEAAKSDEKSKPISRLDREGKIRESPGDPDGADRRRVIDSAMREAASKYKRYATAQPETSASMTNGGLPVGRRGKSTRRRKTARAATLRDNVDDILAVGLGLSK